MIENIVITFKIFRKIGYGNLIKNVFCFSKMNNTNINHFAKLLFFRPNSTKTLIKRNSLQMWCPPSERHIIYHSIMFLIGIWKNLWNKNDFISKIYSLCSAKPLVTPFPSRFVFNECHEYFKTILQFFIFYYYFVLKFEKYFSVNPRFHLKIHKNKGLLSRMGGVTKGVRKTRIYLL